MLKSEIRIKNGIPSLWINDAWTPAMAYTTYFCERSRHKDFIRAGYRIFFVNVSLTGAPINSMTGFTPFRKSIFEDPDHPDYSEFEDYVRQILLVCPEAIIFPRIYVSMPRWWAEMHPDDVVPTSAGGNREALFSEAFRKDGAELLTRLIRHIKNAPYADRIAGWQICGGQTQEWFHHGHNNVLGTAAQKAYGEWMQEVYGIENAALPSETDFTYKEDGYNGCENARRYSVFANVSVARTLDFFASVVKKETDYRQIVGAFYGYSFESNQTVVFGSHALRILLDSPNLNFFSSPNAYAENRRFGIDWADMLPVDSLRNHGKLCFIECDIRTYLTSGIQEARPGEYPDDLYRANGASVWVGPPTAELSREALRKSFAHQLTKASAVWWFDMWGGWYRDPLLMEELKRMKEIYESPFSGNESVLSPEVVFFADERGYSNLLCKSPHLNGITLSRTAMGNTGVPFDSCMVEDAEAILHKYKAAVFPMPIASEAGERAMALCENRGIPYLTATSEHFAFTTEELCAFLKGTKAHCYTEDEDVVYVGNGYLALHSAVGGLKTIRLPRICKVSCVFGAEYQSETTDIVTFTLQENATALFYIC